jgi:8-oxo-dGTP diphosphatase
VRYWLLQVVGGELRFDHEVDEARWLAPADATALLSYERDVTLLRGL